MSFFSPIWLWGLLGLAIPIGIHLLSRKEGKTIYIGSLRHLMDSNTTRFSSLRLNEILLLLLRVALITLVVFILAGLILPFNNNPDRKWLLIEKGIENDQNLKPLIDSLQRKGFEPRFLSRKFPHINDSSSIKPIANYNGLLQDIENEQPDEAVILSHTFADQFKGKRISLPESCRWISIEPETKNFIYDVTKLKGDSLKVRSGQSSSGYTTFKTKFIHSSQVPGSVYRDEKDTAVISPAKSFIVRLYFSQPFEKDMTFVAAGLEAISSEIGLPLIITKENISNYTQQQADINFWISHEPTPATFKNGIAFRKCEQSNQSILMPANHASLFCDHVQAAEWVITKRLTQENILKENFTLALAKIVGSKLHDNDRSYADQRILPAALAWSKSDHKTNVQSSHEQSMETYLSLLLLLTLAAERWVAFKKNQ